MESSAPIVDPLTADEAAAVLGVTSRRVRQFARKGRLKGKLAGTMWIFSRAEVERFHAIERRPGRAGWSEESTLAASQN